MAWEFFQLVGGASRPRMAGKTEPSLRARAMRFLARREHSREELQRKLVPLAAEGDDVAALLDDLAKRGWLSDRRVAEQHIRSRARRFGPLRLAQQLRAKGIDEQTIAAGFRSAEIDPTATRMQTVWASRFTSLPGDDRERARQVRFLQGRGFALGEVLKFIKATHHE
jgi:regulatory protein